MNINQVIDSIPRYEIQAGYGPGIYEHLEAEGDWVKFKELCTLLNKPAKLPMIDAHNERLIASLRNRVNELEAAKTQGEPVAWQHRVTAGPQTGWSLWAPGRGKEYSEHYTVEVRPLYAEQPAPSEAERQTLLELQHELAILHDIFKLYPGAWCCETARRSNGWHHVSTCKNWVLVY